MFFSSKSPLEQAQKANKMQEQQQKHHYNGIHIYKGAPTPPPKGAFHHLLRHRGVSKSVRTGKTKQITVNFFYTQYQKTKTVLHISLLKKAKKMKKQRII